MKHECDIILLSYENPELLKKCVESVLDNTRVPSRLIIVDNDSKDEEVKKYINGIEGRGKIEVEKVFNPANAGFAGGVNKGLELSTAPFSCILNNDCEVHDGWLSEMMGVASKEERIGLVNPQSNTFGCHDPVSVRDKKGRFIELGHAIGFACLIKKVVIEKIGFLDEAYAGVCYEDTDYACRAQEAGFISVMAEGAYVYHKEQASRSGLSGKNEIYRRNRELFESRWGKLLRMLFLEDSPKEGRIIADYAVIKETARERVIVDMWMQGEREKAINDAIEEAGIIRHADVGIKIFPSGISPVAVIAKVLTKKKKYAAILTRNIFIFRILRVFGFLRGTEVFLIKEKSGLSDRKNVIHMGDIPFLPRKLREI